LLVEQQEIFDLYLFDVLLAAKRPSNIHTSRRSDREDPKTFSLQLRAKITFGSSFHRSSHHFAGGRA
jgi:hypothetical protein